MNQEKSGICNEAYFFDTYALIELFRKRLSYAPYKNSRIVTNIFVLYELYYNLRKVATRNELIPLFDDVHESCVEIAPEFLIDAAEFRLEHKKLQLSYADCLGYVMALRFGMKFLTGDREFERLPNVEYVK